ncbi:hypothetical protein DE146DRAFT_788688 [Phaeosphaeria sp. MPI-PUGE-AT-0046c]|nr:hypothetical protein DE146DRAFT_788688 [Phaeosphaeria sp. MPI-PUGE-AT-0046c]
MSTFKNVIIVGAGGNVGAVLLDTLLKESSFKVTVLSRQSSQSTFPSGVQALHADYDSQDSLAKAFKGQDVVVSLVASDVLKDQTKLIDAAIAAGVQRFLPSEFGSDTVDPRNRALVPISKDKHDIIKYLKSNESKISWTSIISGPFFDWCLRVGFHGFDYKNKTATLYDNGTAKFSTTNLHTVALTVVKALEKAELTKNQYVYVAGFQTSQKEILAIAEKITDTKWTVNDVPAKDMIEKGHTKIQQEDYSGILDLLISSTFGEDEVGYLDPAKLWNEKLGLPEDDLESSIRAVFSE